MGESDSVAKKDSPSKILPVGKNCPSKLMPAGKKDGHTFLPKQDIARGQQSINGYKLEVLLCIITRQISVKKHSADNHVSRKCLDKVNLGGVHIYQPDRF